jgi:methanogenic corrinoid protein MtbC1/DNA-binding XRE family transcriptional regulator
MVTAPRQPKDGGKRARSRGALDHRYLEALVRGDAAGAGVVIEEAGRRGLTVEQIYLHLLAPALAEVGARWRAQRLSVADEHLASEITLREMERLRERLPFPPRSGPRAVLACVQGETHAIGLRMVGDFLTLDGWTIDYLGANVPTDDLAELVARRRPVLVALSVTQADRLPALRLAVSAMRALGSAAAVLVGGAALRGRANAAVTLGVDAVAVDAPVGVQEARRFAMAARESPGAVENYFERLGLRVQELRSGRGWTQQQLADEAGLDRTYISGLERGKQNPTIGALLRLAAALETPLDRLVVPGAPAASP